MSDQFDFCDVVSHVGRGYLRITCQDCVDERLQTSSAPARVNPAGLAQDESAGVQRRSDSPEVSVGARLEVHCVDALCRVGGNQALTLRLHDLPPTIGLPLTLSVALVYGGKEIEVGPAVFDSLSREKVLSFVVRHSGVQVFVFRIAGEGATLEASFSELVIVDDRDSSSEFQAYFPRTEVNVHLKGSAILDDFKLPGNVSRLNLEMDETAIASGLDAQLGSSRESQEGRRRSWICRFHEVQHPASVRHPHPSTQACLRSSRGIRHIRLLAGAKWWLGRHGYMPEPGKHPIDLHLRSGHPDAAEQLTRRISGNHVCFEFAQGAFLAHFHGSNACLIDGRSVSAIGAGPHVLKEGMSLHFDSRLDVAELKVVAVTGWFALLGRTDALAAHECWLLVARDYRPGAAADDAAQARRLAEASILNSLGLPLLAHFEGGFWEVPLPGGPAAAIGTWPTGRPLGFATSQVPDEGTWLPVAHPELL